MSSVLIALDTRPPILSIEAPHEVVPLDDWPVIIRSDEPIGDAHLDFLDTLGGMRSVGYEQIDPQTLKVLVPTYDLATGPGSLEGWVSDLACNQTVLAVEVIISRPRPYEVILEFGTAYGISVGIEKAYEVVETIDLAYGVQVVTGA